MTDRGLPSLVAVQRALVTVNVDANTESRPLEFSSRRYTVKIHMPVREGYVIVDNIATTMAAGERPSQGAQQLTYSLETPSILFAINETTGVITSTGEQPSTDVALGVLVTDCLQTSRTVVEVQIGKDIPITHTYRMSLIENSAEVI